MILPRIYRHSSSSGQTKVSTKKLKLSNNSELYFQISSIEEAPMNLIESQIVGLAADPHLRGENADILLGKLLDVLNRAILAQGIIFSRAKLMAFIGIIVKEEVSFSICGTQRVYLSQNGRILNIADGMEVTDGTFSYVSTGSIKSGDALFVSNIDLLSFLTSEDLEELQGEPNPDVIEDLISREADEEVDCLVFSHSDDHFGVAAESIARLNQAGPGFLKDIFTFSRENGTKLLGYIKSLDIPARSHKILSNSKIQAITGRKEVRIGAYALGIVVAIGLLTLVVRSLFTSSLSKAVPVEYKNKLIEAEQILSRTGRDLANREAFKANIKQAENLVFEVRDKKIFTRDVDSLLEQISVLKRQLNGVESFTLTADTTLFGLPKDLLPQGVFEYAKRYFVVTKNGVYGPLIKGSEAKLVKFPDSEVYKSADMTSEGVLYVLTESDRVLKFLKGEFVYVNVEGQASWQKSSAIHTFNSNLYLLADKGNEILRHRPSVGGFSSKVMITNPDGLALNPILDFTIENGFYAIRSDLTIDKLFTTPSVSRQGLVINKLPDNYRNVDGTSPRIVASTSSSFVYILLDGNIWVFEPDSRNFKDVRSLKFIGQIEVSGTKVLSIIIGKDGELLGLTNTGLVQIKFEVVDSKLRLR